MAKTKLFFALSTVLLFGCTTTLTKRYDKYMESKATPVPVAMVKEDLTRVRPAMPDIFGIRLGMDAEEARKIITKSFPKHKTIKFPVEKTIDGKVVQYNKRLYFTSRESWSGRETENPAVELFIEINANNKVWLITRESLFYGSKLVDFANAEKSLLAKYGKASQFFYVKDKSQVLDWYRYNWWFTPTGEQMSAMKTLINGHDDPCFHFNVKATDSVPLRFNKGCGHAIYVDIGTKPLIGPGAPNVHRITTTLIDSYLRYEEEVKKQWAQNGNL
jgi:hypothetical protein